MKFKGIDEGSHKRWIMWFNLMQCKKPYQGLTCRESFLKEKNALGNTDIGGAWLLSARVVRCWVKFRNEHNPRV